MPMNSTWETGDFDGDGDFGTSDLVAAFVDGGYEVGRREAINSVPEPASFLSLMIGLTLIAMRRRQIATRCPCAYSSKSSEDG